MQMRQIGSNQSALKKSGMNFLGILNDIKRRPEDAASELNIPVEQIESIISGNSELTNEIIEKAVKLSPTKQDDIIFDAILKPIMEKFSSK